MLPLLKHKWLDLGITAKVGLILVILVLACLIVAGSAFVQNSRTTEKLQDVATTLLPASRLSRHALTTFTEALQLYEDAVVTNEELFLKKGQQKEQEVENTLQQIQTITAAHITESSVAVSALQADLAAHTEQAVPVYTDLILAAGETANEQLIDQALLLGKKALVLHNRLESLNTSLQKLLDKQLADVRSFTERQQRMGVLLTLLTIFLALLISFLLTRLITRPIVALAATARRISKGTWTGELIADGNDEISELTRSFSEMLTVLHQREEALLVSEKKYREIFNATSEAIVIYDADTMAALDANKTSRRMSGYSLEEFLSSKFSDMSADVPGNCREDLIQLFRKTKDGTPQVFEWLVQNKNGETGWAEFSLTLSELDRKKIIILVARNITDRKNEEAEKAKRAQRQQQADKLETLGTLAGGIAHDFNNILSGVIGYTELATMRPNVGEDVKADLKNVHKAAMRARDLVAQILAFSRKGEQARTIFEPAIIVKEVIKLLRSSTPTTIDIQHTISSRASIEADPTQFHQVAMNLCTNATQAMADTGGLLRITLDEISPADGKHEFPADLPPAPHLRLMVEDSGIGMDEATRKKIFNPYFTTKGVGKGTGLGLSVVHGIVKEQHGKVTVTSAPGQGTIFCIYLPVVKQDIDTEYTTAAPRTDYLVNHTVTAGSGERIMLVDDEPDVVNLLADFLVQANYHICTFSDSREALDVFTATPERYDMIITDMTMPDMTGLELSQKILAIRPELPIILMTGFSEQVNREKALTAGIREFFLKPPDIKKLLSTVHALLAAEE